MLLDDVFFGQMDELVSDIDDLRAGVRDTLGTYRIGHYEDDPNMSEYEDLLELGLSLASR